MNAERPIDRDEYIKCIKEQRDCGWESVAILRGQLAAAEQTMRMLVNRVTELETQVANLTGDKGKDTGHL